MNVLMRMVFESDDLTDADTDDMGAAVASHLDETFNDDGSLIGTDAFTIPEKAAIQAALQCLAQCLAACGGDLPADLADTMTSNGAHDALDSDALADLAASLA